MLLALGRKPKTEGDLVDHLLDCHARIRSFTDLAVAIAERDAPHGEVSEACAKVVRYFSEAMPLHVRDEEESILPRLRGRSASVDAALSGMHDQHELHAGLVERLCQVAAAFRVVPGNESGRGELLYVAQPLRRLFESHLRAEEEIVFPAVRRLLSAEEQSAIRREMELRRRDF